MSVDAQVDCEKSQAGVQDAQARDKESEERIWVGRAQRDRRDDDGWFDARCASLFELD